MNVEGSKNRKKIRKEKRKGNCVEIVAKFFDEKPRLISNGNFSQNRAYLQHFPILDFNRIIRKNLCTITFFEIHSRIGGKWHEMEQSFPLKVIHSASYCLSKI